MWQIMVKSKEESYSRVEVLAFSSPQTIVETESAGTALIWRSCGVSHHRWYTIKHDEELLRLESKKYIKIVESLRLKL